MGQAHVQVVLGGQTLPKGLEAALRRVGATASFGPISEVARLGLKPTADAVVVVAPENAEASYEGLQTLFNHVATRPRATLVLQPEGHHNHRPPYPPAVPVSFSTRVNEEELAIRISTMIEMRASLDTLHRSITSGQNSDEQLARHYRQQLRLASQVQRELLPRTAPSYGHVSLSTVYRPMDYVSGDIYDVRRLDEDHVAVALIDAEGHGISAALLTVFLRRALREEARRNGGPWPPRPHEVLARLNEDLLETDLSECQFAAAVYAVVNLRSRCVELARGGAPYPILRHADGSCQLLRPAGSVVGVIPDVRFERESLELAPGDSLLLYSDGIEPVTRAVEPAPPALASSRRPAGNGEPTPFCQPWATPCVTLGPSSAAATIATDTATTVPPDEMITTTRWYRRLREDGTTAALEQLAARHDMLRRLGRPLDDLTVLAISADC